MKVNGKVIVVTGGGSGMGRELVLQLLGRGAKVIAADINAQSLSETESLAKNGSFALGVFACNITDRSSVENLLQFAITNFGSVDGIINNAGVIQPFVRVNDLSQDTIEKVMQVNFFSTLNMVKTFLPHLLSRHEGHIMNISSMGGFLPVPGQTIYGASKAAVKLLSEGLYAELQGTPVQVTVVFPGAVNTNIAKNSGLELPTAGADQQNKLKVLEASTAAKQMIDAMERNQFQVFVGSDSKMMNLFYRLRPKKATQFIAGKMKSLLK